MRTAYRLPAPTDAAGLRSRVSGLGLALGINLLLLLVLLGLGAARERPRPQPVTTVVELVPEAAKAAEAAKGAAAPKPRTPPVDRPRPVTPVEPALVAPSKQPLDLLVLSKEDLAASDIGKLPKAGSGSGAGDSEEAGHGPNGQVLYAALWSVVSSGRIGMAFVRHRRRWRLSSVWLRRRPVFGRRRGYLLC